MQTKCVQANQAAIAEAAALLCKGEVVAFPTETVYGLGADATNADAVQKIFLAKERPADNPLIVHIAKRAEMLPLVQSVSASAEALMDRFWPGALTIILPKTAMVPDIVSAGLATVAVRMPSHPVALALIEAAGVPIAAPSANRSGKPSPTTAAHVLTDMEGRIPLILDGGAAAFGVESTVVDMTGDVPVLLRPGGVTVEMLREVIPDLMVDEAVLHPLAEGVSPRSPGLKHRHYAPEAEVIIVQGTPERVAERICTDYDAFVAAGHRVSILTSRETAAFYGARDVRPLGSQSDLASMAAALFETLRALDAEGVQRVYAEAVHTGGMGLAFMNRLARAAGFHIEQV